MHAFQARSFPSRCLCSRVPLSIGSTSGRWSHNESLMYIHINLRVCELLSETLIYYSQWLCPIQNLISAPVWSL
jgi:hypothetical protein